MLPERTTLAREQRAEKTRPRGSHSPTQTSWSSRRRRQTSPKQELPGPDARTWLEEAHVFELNADFQISVEPNDQQASLEELVCTIRCDSVNKLTPQALSDKLVRHRIVSNLGIPQMPVHYLVQGNSVEKAEVENFVLTHLCGPQSHPVAIKPTHLRNGVGVIFVGRVAPEDGPQPTVNYLVHHMNKYLAQRPESCEHCEDDLLKPGFMAQEKYEAFLGFDRPLELRVFVLWGRCRLASWWSHGANSGDQPIVTLARNLVHNSRSGSTDEWSVLHSRAGSDPMYYKALEVLQCEVQTIAATAESLATEVGSPFLRADFFVGSERWGIRLNDVACGDALNNSLLELSDESSNSHALAIAHAIRDGHSLCQRRFPPEHFLSRLGVRGGCYKDMVVMDVCYSDSINSEVPSKSYQSCNEVSLVAPGKESTNEVAPGGTVQDLRPKTEQSSFQELPAPRSSKRRDYKLGDDVEVWSKSHQMWRQGRVQKIGTSTISVSFTLPDGLLYAKELPPGHRDLRRASITDPDDSTANNTWKVGDEIEVYSNSRKLWGQGRIQKVAARDGDQVVLARFMMPDGSICEKEMWASSTELRRAASLEGDIASTTPLGGSEFVNTRRPNPATSPDARAPKTFSATSTHDVKGVSPIVGTQHLKFETQDENLQPPNSAPNTSAVQRSPSYVRIREASPQGLQQLSAPIGQTSVAQRTGSYVPPINNAHVVQKAILLTQDRRCVQSPQDGSSAPRSFSYVPPPAESLARQQALSAASPINQTFVPTCTTSQASQPSSYLRVPSKVRMQSSAQGRAASVPPQRVGAPQTSRSFVAPSWASGGQSHPATASAPNGTVAKVRSAHSLVAGGKLQIEDIATAPGLPNPMHPQMRSQILARLGIAPDATIKKMNSFGGQNDGVWLLESGGITCVLKLVRNVNLGIELPTETERFAQLAAACPNLLYDDALTFPMRIFRLRSQVQNPTFDLLVMPLATGERLSDIVSILWALKKRGQVMDIMERAGKFLKDFHARYNNMQHCDFQPSNLFYDEARQKFTLVDLADLGQQALITEKDADRFLNGLRIMGKSLGPEFMETLRHFQAGYTSC
mmetsp:Transcript_62749/g.99120  ORF Transcript_62749/g.99120 Transcript_62749/m.99120 type:complete len:1087 (-) Transcript_62749:8-3268(-)